MPASESRSNAAVAFLAFVAMAVIAGVMVTVSVTPAIAVTGATATGGIGLFQSLPSNLTIAPLDQKTEIYAKSHGKNVLLASFYTQDRDVVTWSEVAQTAKNAAVAGEDVRFYEHGGIDPEGIVRAAVGNLEHKEIQGASTITQQYVKNVCVQEAERLKTTKAIEAAYTTCTDTSFSRKLQEMRYAIGLEKKYTKQEILLGYLNIAGFGGRVYGIQSAAEYYFGVSAAKLSIAQAASLIAIVNDPEDLRLDEKANIAANTTRRNYILKTEYTQKMITKAEYDAAVDQTVSPKITQPKTGCMAAGVAGFFCDYVVNVIENSSAFGKTVDDRYANLYSAGWKIYTTLNLDLQKTAQKVMNTYVPKTSDLLKIGGAAVSVEVGTGRIVTMVQNKNYDNTSNASAYGAGVAVNYNTDYDYGGSSGMQPGSTYKLFTLLDWLKNGHTLDEEVNSDERTIPASDFTQCGETDTGDGPWSVGNDEGASENGEHTVTSAPAASINGAFATMAEQLDLCDIRDMAKSFDVHTATGAPLEDNPSSVIGTNYVSPLTMATAYAGMANEGKTCTPIAIDSVVKSDGTKLAVPASTCTQSVDKQVAIAANSALRAVFTEGTASGDQTADGIYEVGKTGTTDGNANTWMIGTTSKVATAVWVGNVTGSVDLRTIYSFPYCASKGSTQAAIERHCVWNGIQTAVNKVYGGTTSWAQPEAQYVSGSTTTTTSGTVPNVVGMTESEATAALESNSMAWAIGSTVASSKTAGTVVSQSPAAGSSASSGTEVTLHLSSGTG